jgi:hypothetical protein
MSGIRLHYFFMWMSAPGLSERYNLSEDIASRPRYNQRGCLSRGTDWESVYHAGETLDSINRHNTQEARHG